MLVTLDLSANQIEQARAAHANFHAYSHVTYMYMYCACAHICSPAECKRADAHGHAVPYWTYTMIARDDMGILLCACGAQLATDDHTKR